MREIWLKSSMALFWNFRLFCNLFIRIADRTWNWPLSNVLIYALILSLKVCVYFDFKKWRDDFSCCLTKIYKLLAVLLLIVKTENKKGKYVIYESESWVNFKLLELKWFVVFTYICHHVINQESQESHV